MNLYFDERDTAYHKRHGSNIISWLKELGARPIATAHPNDDGFLFAGARSQDDYRKLVGRLPKIRDTVDDRKPLMRLDTVLTALATSHVDVPTSKTWHLPLDAAIPEDIVFPLFVRTDVSSMKMGGRISKVNNQKQLAIEAAELRRQLGWDALVLARQWCDFARAGDGVYGPVPQEVRVWIVDQVPFAWSFHYHGKVKNPVGFPPKVEELLTIKGMACKVGSVFHSRLVVADFGKLTDGNWVFIEAGPGSCAGTAHESVFKAVASRLIGQSPEMKFDAFGGLF